LFHGRVEAGEDRVVAMQQVHQLSRRERETPVERTDCAEMPRVRPIPDPTPAQPIDHLLRVVTRGVVHDDDLGIVAVR
jgi:hypothetical protein